MSKLPKAKKWSLTAVRRIIQIGMLTILGQWAFYGIFRCPFPVPYLSCINCPVITCHGRILNMFWGFWLLLLVSVILFGRMFCGWACPGGLLNQIIGLISFFKLRARNTLNIIVPWGKYPALVIVLYLWLMMDNPRWIVPIRVGEFWNSLVLSFEHANTYWLIRTFFVIGVVVAGFGLANAWCRFVCPTGGILEIVKKLSLFKVYKTEACNDCNECLKICEMGARPDENNCTTCIDCLHACPEDAIKVGRRKIR